MVVLDVEMEDGQREALRRTFMIRMFDTKAIDLFNDGEFPGFVHPYIGEEAVGVGACSIFESDGHITNTHRGHGHCIARGLNPDLVMAELSGKADGYCNDKGGSMHIADVDAGMLGTNGVVGAGPPLAMRVALTSHLKGENTVALAFFGDGVVAQGQVHEAVNPVTTWSFPAVFPIENNQYGKAAPVEKQRNVQNFSETTEVYNILGSAVDGMDITTIYEAIKEAHKRAADGEEPAFIEAETYRYHGHFEDDQQLYRTEEDVAIWKDRDAVETFKRRLVDVGTVTEAEFDETKTGTDQQIENTVGKVKDVMYLGPGEAYEDMFNAVVPEISGSSNGMQADGGENR